MSQDVKYYRSALGGMRKALERELEDTQSLLSKRRSSIITRGVLHQDVYVRLSAAEVVLEDVLSMVLDILDESVESETERVGEYVTGR